MGKYSGTIAGAIQGGIAGGIWAAPAGGVTIPAGILIGAIIGGLAGSVPLIADAIWGKKIDLPVATARIQDQQINTYTRTGRMPLVYGQREVGANVLQLGKLEYKDVLVSETGRNESHLFGDILLGLAEGPCQAAVAIYMDDTPQPTDRWRFVPGLQDDQKIPELDPFCPEGRNPRYPNVAKIFFSGDMGFVSSIPDFRISLRGVYPTVEVDGDYAAAWRPAAAWLDGPTNTVWVRPGLGYDAPVGLLTYEVPLRDGAPTVAYTAPPSDFETDPPQSWYFGRVGLVLMQDPANARAMWFGRPGLEAGSTEWARLDMGAAYANEVLLSCVDDRACRLHTLHRRDDGVRYIVVLSAVTTDRLQHVLPDPDFTGEEQFAAMQFKAEDNAYWFVVSGGTAGDGLLAAYTVTTREWRGVASLDASGALGVVKLGVYAFIFFTQSVTRVNTVTGEVTDGLPLSDFLGADDGEALGERLFCESVSQSAHRYAGVAVIRNVSWDWRIAVFHEQRAVGESYAVPTPYRRFVMGDAQGAVNYLAKPGWDATPPDDLSSIFWVTSEPVDVNRSLEDTIALGADYKTVDPTGEVEVLLEGCRVFSWFPIRNNQQLPRRVVFAKLREDGKWEFWWTVKAGAIPEDTSLGGTLDFVLPDAGADGTSLMLFDQRWPKPHGEGDEVGGWHEAGDAKHIEIYGVFDINPPSDEDDFYVGPGAGAYWTIGGDAGEIEFVDRFIESYAGAVHVLTLTEDHPGWLSFIRVTSPRWFMQTFSIVTPTAISVPKAFGGAPVAPSMDMGGRMVARFENLSNVVDEIADIIDLLNDRTDPDTPIPVYDHGVGSTTTLRGVRYSFDVYQRFNFVPSAPLAQFGTIGVKGDELVPAIAARLNEAQTPDVYRDAWFEREIGGKLPGYAYFHWSGHFRVLRRDCYGLTAQGEQVLVAGSAVVGSWESYRLKLVQEDKADTITLTVRPDGFHHDWFERRVTVPSIIIDLGTNNRYGRGLSVPATTGADGDIAATSWMSLHGYSLEPIMVDGDVLRRFICNYVRAEEGTFDDICQELLTPVLARLVTLDGKLGVSFDCGDTQPVAEFDVSNIAARSFASAVKGPKSSINRVRVLFQNDTDRRDDSQPADDEDDQDSTGSVREQSMEAPAITDPRRAAFIAHRVLQATLTDRQGVQFSTGPWANMVLDPGDIVAVTHPQGRYERRPYRIIDVEDAGDVTQLAAAAVAPFTLDANRVSVSRQQDGQDHNQQRGGGDGRTRDSKPEAFHGRSLMPMRVLAVRRDDGNLILMAHRAPASVATSAVVAKLAGPDDEQTGDARAVAPRSVALTESVPSAGGEVAFVGLLDSRQLIPLPAAAYLVKKLTGAARADLVEQVRLTAYAPPRDALDPSGAGSVTVERPLWMDGQDAEVQTASSDSVWVTTAATGEDDPDPEPVTYDGHGTHASAWANAGEWSEVTAGVDPVGALLGVAALALRLDYLVIGVTGDGLWMPNSLRITLATAASSDQLLVWEYSCEPDPSSPLGVWKPLTVLDGTLGLRQSGRVLLEIPPGWARSGRWDQHGHFVGGDDGSKPVRYWIRCQRRQRLGSGVAVESIQLENLPVLMVEPPSPALRRPPERSQGRDLTYRFIARGPYPDDAAGRHPGSLAVSPGDRWRLLSVAYPSLVETGAELSDLDVIATEDGQDYTVEWAYTSASHGWGSAAFAGTAFGVADDPHLLGVIVTVSRQSDGQTLSTTTVQRPTAEFGYAWADRQADGNVPVAIEIRQYDDRGFVGPPLRVLIGSEAYS